MNRITDYQPADLTVTVEAGVRMSELAAALRREKQILPLDAPFAGEATAGGVIATNGSGPRRLAYGTARDMVLGIHFVTAEGTLAKSGGKVVKNVAGYDMAKLLIGSLGSFGIVTDITFKTFPNPPASATLLCGFESAEQALRAAQRILHSPFAPQALDLLDSEAWSLLPERPFSSMPSTAFVLAIGTAGPEPVVERIGGEIPTLLQAERLSEIIRLTGTAESDLWGKIQELTPSFLRARSDGVVIKSSVVVTRIEEVLAAAQHAASENGLASAALARAGTGIVYTYFWPRTEEASSDGSLSRSCEFLVRQSEQLGGRAVVEWAPASVKEKVNLWGTPGDDFTLMQRLKAQFDPHGILNPGRFYGGI